jgi:hypothetical protein
VVLTADGVKVTKNLNLVIMGLKEMETASMPLLASHLLRRGNNDDDDGFGQLDQQSAFQCFPLKCIFGHESSDFLSKHFKDKYHRIMATAEPGPNGQNCMFPEYKPFTVSCPADMKLAWLATGKGGAAKQKENFYYCCLMTSKDINKANDVPCADCAGVTAEEISDLEPLNVEYECLHQEFITADLLDRLRLQISAYISEEVKNTHRVVTERIKLLLFEDDSDIRKCNDPQSIDYKPATLLAMENFHAFLITEGEQRNIEYGTWDTLDELRMILKRRVREEQLLTILQKALEHGDPKEGALYLIEHAIPCILHLENRTLLKLLMLLLVDGWSNAKKRCLPESSHIASMKVREDMFLETVSKAMNTEILGAPGNVGQWKVPLDHSQSGERSIGQVNFENYRG